MEVSELLIQIDTRENIILFSMNDKDVIYVGNNQHIDIDLFKFSIVHNIFIEQKDGNSYIHIDMWEG